MKLSKKEKILICVLGMLIVGYGYYEFIYSKQVTKIDELANKRNEIEDKYTSAMNTIASLENRKNEQKILLTKVTDKTDSFYPLINQESIIIELNSLLDDSKLIGALNFESIETKGVESIDKKQKSIKESSIQPTADKFKVLAGEKADTEKSTDSESNNLEEKQQENSDADTENNESNKSESTDNKNEVTVQQIKCDVNFKGSYKSLNSFLKSLETNPNKIVAKSVKISESTIDEVSGILELEFYAIPKVDDKEVEKYLEWKFNNVYGKESPFSTGAATGASSSTSSYTQDFNMYVRSNTSVLPSVTVCKSDDELKNSYVYSNKNSEEKVQLTLTKKDDVYYYKYSTSNDRYPKENSSLGVGFIPVGDNIVIDISSEKRVDDDDKSSLNLNIVNNTDKLAVVNISADDSKSPRVTVGGDGSKISINNK